MNLHGSSTDDDVTVCASVSYRALEVCDRALRLIQEADPKLGARLIQEREVVTRDTGMRIPVLGGLAEAPLQLKEHPMAAVDRAFRSLAELVAAGGPVQTPAAVALVALSLVDTVRVTTTPSVRVLAPPKEALSLAGVDVRMLNPTARVLVLDARNLIEEFSERAVEERRAILKRSDEIISTWSPMSSPRRADEPRQDRVPQPIAPDELLTLAGVARALRVPEQLVQDFVSHEFNGLKLEAANSERSAFLGSAVERFRSHLDAPWPEDKRKIPDFVERYADFLAEASGGCPSCQRRCAHYDYAHIDPWARTRCHSPHNILRLCLECHRDHGNDPKRLRMIREAAERRL